MAITIIQPVQLKEFLVDQGMSTLVQNPKLHEIMASLVSAVHLKLDDPSTHQKAALEIPAYHYETQEEHKECLQRMVENGHYVPRRGMDPKLPKAPKEAIQKLLGRAKENFLAHCYLSLMGMVYLQGEVDMVNDLADWYDRLERKEENPHGSGKIVREHIKVLYEDHQPYVGTFQNGKTHWTQYHNGAIDREEVIDNFALQVVAMPQNFHVEGIAKNSANLLGDLEKYAPNNKWKVINIIRGYRALGLVEQDFAKEEEQAVIDSGVFIPERMR